jgi:diguanylate cyclase (GGDEF)-like protein
LAVEQQDIKKIQDLCHLLKGSSSTLGVDGLADIAKELQLAAIEQSQATQLNHVHQLKHNFVEISKLLNTELSETRHKIFSDITLVSHQQRSQSEHPYILIVDDDRTTRLSLRGCLEQDRYYIEEAHNGAIAVTKCERNIPDMILMNALMEEMNGFEAMSRILKLPSDFKPPILMLTASDDEDVVDMAFEYGATDFIPKPINLHVLRNRVAHLIRTTQAERRIHQLAYHDPLTCLPNRTQFMEKFTQSLHRVKSNNGMLALMFIDLDKFKLINDTQGHEIGDMLLKAVSKRISHCVRTDDLVVRLGGDEFTILLEDIQTSSIAAKVANKICKILAEPFTFMNKAVRAPVSVGISVYPSDGQDINTLMKHADTAMYRAKSHGGSQFQFYEYGMEAELVRRVELERDLRKAIDKGELVLHYQPQIDLKTGNLMGAEALVRWNHPERGFMSPEEFIPLAEESGLIIPLGEWVLNKSCEQIKLWINKGLDLDFVAVNLSGHQMKQAYLLERVKSCLDTNQLDAKHIQLEMTESVMAVESESCLNLLNGLKEMGISVAIDDFGTGYSSLSYLTKFPVDTLKIDYSFVTNLPSDKDSATVTSGIIALAHKLGMQVIAEGVETKVQRDFLQQEQCDWIQGYLISRPLPPEELETWLNTYDPVNTIKP